MLQVLYNSPVALSSSRHQQIADLGFVEFRHGRSTNNIRKVAQVICDVPGAGQELVRPRLFNCSTISS